MEKEVETKGMHRSTHKTMFSSYMSLALEPLSLSIFRLFHLQLNLSTLVAFLSEVENRSLLFKLMLVCYFSAIYSTRSGTCTQGKFSRFNIRAQNVAEYPTISRVLRPNSRQLKRA